MQKLKIIVLIASYNGEKFLKRQLESIYNQDFDNIDIYVSDDGSKDNTLNILKDFQHHPSSIKLHVINGPQKGFAQNFLSLVQHLPSKNHYFYAFCDQDDIWHSKKLSHALKKLDLFNQDLPLLYCSRTRLINEHEEITGESPLFTKKPSFANALVQNIGGGNTMVFNQKTFELLKLTPNLNNIVSHYCWAYLLTTGAGGHVFYSPEAFIDYRQHGANIIGSNQGIIARLKRIKGLIDGKFKGWNTQNIAELTKLSNLLTPENQMTLNTFAQARKKFFPFNLFHYFKIKLYRQTFFGNLGLIFAIITNKI